MRHLKQNQRRYRQYQILASLSTEMREKSDVSLLCSCRRIDVSSSEYHWVRLCERSLLENVHQFCLWLNPTRLYLTRPHRIPDWIHTLRSQTWINNDVKEKTELSTHRCGCRWVSCPLSLWAADVSLHQTQHWVTESMLSDSLWRRLKICLFVFVLLVLVDLLKI